MSVKEQIQREQDEILLASADSDGAEVAIFELIDRQPSGFIREGTERMNEPTELDVAGFRQIKIRSAYYELVPEGKGPNKKMVRKRIPIRYRQSANSIFPDQQDAEGAPENFENDRIVFKNGTLIVVNEGLTAQKFAYMKKDSYNQTNPNRIPTVEAIYREVFPEQEDDKDNEQELLIGRAMGLIDGLFEVEDGKKVYDELRLSAYASMFNIKADGPAGIVKGLIATAKHNPESFIAKARGMQEKLIVDIDIATQLGVILFENGSVIYPEKNKVLLSIPNQIKEDRQALYLAGYFMSEKGNFHYQEFLIELNAARERKLGNE